MEKHVFLMKRKRRSSVLRATTSDLTVRHAFPMRKSQKKRRAQKAITSVLMVKPVSNTKTMKRSLARLAITLGQMARLA
jgi:hypothetical protein